MNYKQLIILAASISLYGQRKPDDRIQVEKFFNSYIQAEQHGDSEWRVDHGFFGNKNIPKGDEHPGRFDVYREPVEAVSRLMILSLKEVNGIWEIHTRYFLVAELSKKTGVSKITVKKQFRDYTYRVIREKNEFMIKNPGTPKVEIGTVIKAYEDEISSYGKNVGFGVLEREAAEKKPRGLRFSDMKVELSMLKVISADLPPTEK